jgi:hypothetical protein
MQVPLCDEHKDHLRHRVLLRRGILLYLILSIILYCVLQGMMTSNEALRGIGNVLSGCLLFPLLPLCLAGAYWVRYGFIRGSAYSGRSLLTHAAYSSDYVVIEGVSPRFIESLDAQRKQRPG